MSRGRAALRWVAAGFSLQVGWLFVTESWREHEPFRLAIVIILAGTLVSGAWQSIIRTQSLRTTLVGAAWLALALAAVDQLIDLIIPYPRRYGLVDWEAARVASVVAGFALGYKLTAASQIARAWRHVARVLAIASLLFALLVPAMMVYLAVDGSRDSGEPADVALVLGFALSPDGSPRPQLLGRIAHAIELAKSGRVQRLIVSGGVARGGHTEAEVMRDLALAAGIPAERVVLENDSRSTIENFACARPLLSQLGVRRVLLVTEPWHMKRAMLLAHRHGLDLIPSPASSPIWESPRHGTYWLFRDAVAYIRERTRDPFAVPGVCNARECEGCRTF